MRSFGVSASVRILLCASTAVAYAFKSISETSQTDFVLNFKESAGSGANLNDADMERLASSIKGWFDDPSVAAKQVKPHHKSAENPVPSPHLARQKHLRAHEGKLKREATSENTHRKVFGEPGVAAPLKDSRRVTPKSVHVKESVAATGHLTAELRAPQQHRSPKVLERQRATSASIKEPPKMQLRHSLPKAAPKASDKAAAPLASESARGNEIAAKILEATKSIAEGREAKPTHVRSESPIAKVSGAAALSDAFGA